MPPAKPSISVIMPVYNAAPYLRRALDSVCDQSFRDLEILCVNDGSTDESPAILAEYAAADPRIRLIDHGKNRGYSCAMNSGFDAATGETIGVVDSDDAISKNFYAELWRVYEAGDCDIVKGRLVDCELDGRWHEKNLNIKIQKNLFQFSHQWQAAIYRTDFLRTHTLRLSTDIGTGQDTLFLYQLIGHEPRIAFTDKAIYFYLRNGASMTKAHPDAYYLAARVRLAGLLKKSLPAYPRQSQRRKIFGCIINSLWWSLTETTSDATPHLPEIQAILAGDQYFAPQGDFPFVRQALEAKSIQDLATILKKGAVEFQSEGSSGALIARTLRENLRKKSS